MSFLSSPDCCVPLRPWTCFHPHRSSPFRISRQRLGFLRLLPLHLGPTYPCRFRLPYVRLLVFSRSSRSVLCGCRGPCAHLRQQLVFLHLLRRLPPASSGPGQSDQRGVRRAPAGRGRQSLSVRSDASERGRAALSSTETEREGRDSWWCLSSLLTAVNSLVFLGGVYSV